MRRLAPLLTVLLTLALAPAALADNWYASPPLTRLTVEPPYRSQIDDSVYARSDCGPAVLGMVLADYGIQQDTLDLRRMTHTYQGTWPAVRVGTALQHMAHVASDFGLNAYGLYDDEQAQAFHQWTTDEIAAQVAAGRLVIPLVRFSLLPGHEDTGIRFGHYILLYALQDEGFLYQDPDIRPIEEGHARWISRAQLARAMAPAYPSFQAVAISA